MTAERGGLRRLLVGAVIAALVVIVFALVVGSSAAGPEAAISIFSTRFLGLFIEAAPFLLLGSLASGLIESFVSAEDITRIVPRSPVAAAVVGALMGFIFPVCECGVVPVVRRLYRKGLPVSVGVSFLLASPVINPIVIAGTYVAFGFSVVFVGRIVITLVVATAVGLIFAASNKPSELLRAPSLSGSTLGGGDMPRFAPVMGGSGEQLPTMAGRKAAAGARRPLAAGLRDALVMAGDEFFDMGRYLILGSLAAAAMQTVVSQEVLLALGRGPVVSVLVMQLLAYVLSVCSTVDAFLALAFTGTFTTGSILAFLTFGPMVDIKSTIMFAGVFKRKAVIYLIVMPLLMTLLIGIWINLNLAL